ncbi:hypothetical protein BDN71DRAFT_516278 [Pleurotus eryngii]|uniref:Uncharacterized protein n=1 Tax=Pleurotus eryngii TaxID=5323 RepID=A0A9P6A2F7_PLEER|nr:hypothetical protein BDN71DRAFT_516278 [Pleurotus eryngii]
MQLYDNFDSPTPQRNLQPRLNIVADSQFPDAVQWETFLEFIAGQNITVACLDCRAIDRELSGSIYDSIQVLRLAGDASFRYFLRALEDYGSFTVLECIHFQSVSVAPIARTIPAVKRWHSARCAAGGRKVTFNFHWCGISESNVLALERSKCKVRWDGIDCGQ